MRRRSFLAALGAAGQLAFSAAAVAKPKLLPLADAPARAETVVEVSVLHATHDKRDPDPRVGDVPELREGPFANYQSYELLSRATFWPLDRSALSVRVAEYRARGRPASWERDSAPQRIMAHPAASGPTLG